MLKNFLLFFNNREELILKPKLTFLPTLPLILPLLRRGSLRLPLPLKNGRSHDSDKER